MHILVNATRGLQLGHKGKACLMRRSNRQPVFPATLAAKTGTTDFSAAQYLMLHHRWIFPCCLSVPQDIPLLSDFQLLLSSKQPQQQSKQ
jgi:hypothetical protein